MKGTAVSLLLRVGGAGLGFLFNLLLAKLLGVEGAGMIFLALSIVGLATLIARLGLDSILVREVAALLTAGHWAEIRAIGRTGVGLVSVAALTLTIILWGAAPFLADIVFSKPGLSSPLRGLALAIVPWALSLVLSELLRGGTRFVQSQVIQALAAGAVSLPVLALSGGQGGLDASVLALVAGQFAAFLLALYWWLKLLAEKTGNRFSPPADRMALLRSASPLLGFMLLNTMMGSLDILLLGALGSVADLGIYGIAVRLAMLTSFILLATNSYISPQFAALYHEGNIDGLAALAQRSARLSLLIATPLLLLFLMVPETLLGLIGTDFKSGAPVLTILACAQFINVATGSVGQILIMTRNEKVLRNISFISAAATAFLLITLIPPFGAVGAAVATGTGICMQNIAAMLAVQRLYGIRVDAFKLTPRLRRTLLTGKSDVNR